MGATHPNENASRPTSQTHIPPIPLRNDNRYRKVTLSPNTSTQKRTETPYVEICRKFHSPPPTNSKNRRIRDYPTYAKYTFLVKFGAFSLPKGAQYGGGTLRHQVRRMHVQVYPILNILIARGAKCVNREYLVRCEHCRDMSKQSTYSGYCRAYYRKSSITYD